MGGNSTPEELFNLNDLRVELLQSAARDLFGFSMRNRQLLRCAQRGVTDVLLQQPVPKSWSVAAAVAPASTATHSGRASKQAAEEVLWRGALRSGGASETV